MEKKALFGIAVIALGLLAVFGLATYVPYVPRPRIASIPAEASRCIVLELSWGGDIYTSTETSCDVWIAWWECELRRGGSAPGEGIIMTKTLPLTGTIAMVDPPSAGVVTTNTLCMPLDGLPVGPHEVWCRLVETNGEDTIWGYIPGQGQELDGYCLVDQFGVGQICGVARTFQGWVQ
jgi:hypothetical protein